MLKVIEIQWIPLFIYFLFYSFADMTILPATLAKALRLEVTVARIRIDGKETDDGSRYEEASENLRRNVNSHIQKIHRCSFVVDVVIGRQDHGHHHARSYSLLLLLYDQHRLSRTRSTVRFLDLDLQLLMSTADCRSRWGIPLVHIGTMSL